MRRPMKVVLASILAFSFAGVAVAQHDDIVIGEVDGKIVYEARLDWPRL